MMVSITDIFPRDSNSTGKVTSLIELGVKEIGIPPRPQILIQIRAEMEKDDPSYHLLSSVISADVAIAASLIKTANSPGLGLRTRVCSVNEALMALGLNIASYAVAALALRKIFPHTPSMERFWGFSSRISRVAGWLARRTGDIRPDDAFTFGLFRDCGIPILMIPFKDVYPSVLHQANDESIRGFTEVEDELIGANHASIGADMAESWLLPKDMAAAIRHHHSLTALDQASDLSELTKQLIAVSQLAEHLIQHNTGRSHTQEWLKVGPACLNFLNISDEDCQQLYADSEEVTKDES